MNRRHASRSHGFTHLELVIATVLLAATLLTITRFQQSTRGTNLAAQRASFAHSRLLNVRREISTWPTSEVTAETISELPIDEANFLPQAQWMVEIKEIDEPVAGKQVTMAIKWQDKAQTHTCPSLTFWVKRP